MRVIYPKNRPNQTCDYWLITPNQQTLCIETISFSSGQLQNNTVKDAMSITINRVIRSEIDISLEITLNIFKCLTVSLSTKILTLTISSLDYFS